MFFSCCPRKKYQIPKIEQSHTYIYMKKMDFLHHGRVGSYARDSFGYTALSLNVPSPSLSRRRSASPLMSPATGSITPQLLQRNRQEASFPQTDDEQLHLFQERIMWSQEKSLLPLAHDLADWMNSILGVDLCPGNLMERLETGVILHQLAKLIEEKASLSDNPKVPRPKLKGKVRANASRGSFFARDNVAIFLSFCKELGVHNNLLFETEDLVSHGEIRSVLICLMEVGRLSVKYGIDPPALVAMEHQIDNDANRITDTDQTDSSHHEEEDDAKENQPCSLTTPGQNLSDSLDSGLPVEEEQSSVEDFKGTTDLDIKVNEVARISGKSCCCVEETRKNFKLRKLSEGKYLINGRTVFVRLLKGVHVMVRIGGGWETLEEFLVRNDPCRAKRNSVQRRASFGVVSNSSNRPSTAPPVINSTRNNSSTCSTPTRTRSRHSSRQSLFH